MGGVSKTEGQVICLKAGTSPITASALPVRALTPLDLDQRHVMPVDEAAYWQYCPLGPMKNREASSSGKTLIQTRVNEEARGGGAEPLRKKLLVESLTRQAHRRRIKAIVAAKRKHQLHH